MMAPMPDDVYRRAAAAYAALDGLPASLRGRFTAEARILTAPVGTVLFEPGSPCQAFPLVLEGAVRVARLAESGREIVLYRVVPGEPCVVTTHCLVGHGDYPARGTVETPLTAVAVPSPLFDALLAGHAPFRTALMTHFAERVMTLMTLVEEIAFGRLDARLGAVLASRGPEVRITHQALAEELGSVREAISRLLKQFESHGWIRLGRERIDVVDANSLRTAGRAQ
jgi:CRP/FNR family transcriptional regulator, anaerobic regulatory protein